MNEECNMAHTQKLTKAKARKILKDGSVRGHKLTVKQRAFFGSRAGGAPVKRTGHRIKRRLKR